jgi:DNA-binding PadR family transcriptional regulator
VTAAGTGRERRHRRAGRTVPCLVATRPDGEAARYDAPVVAAPELSLNEWVVLALLREAPAHGFALARQLHPASDLGRILTVHRPLVYRALDRLVDAGLAEPQRTEPGDGGPNRVVHRATRRGHRAAAAWLREPVTHIREMRIEFLLKLRLVERHGDDPRPLVTAQQEALADTLHHLSDPGTVHDVVDRWRSHSARATSQFLAELAATEERVDRAR